MMACIVAQTIMLIAKQLGYDSGPMDGVDYGAVGRIINLPDDLGIALMIAIGMAIKNPWPRPGQLQLLRC